MGAEHQVAIRSIQCTAKTTMAKACCYGALLKHCALYRLNDTHTHPPTHTELNAPVFESGMSLLSGTSRAPYCLTLTQFSKLHLTNKMNKMSNREQLFSAGLGLTVRQFLLALYIIPGTENRSVQCQWHNFEMKHLQPWSTNENPITLLCSKNALHSLLHTQLNCHSESCQFHWVHTSSR